MPSVLTAVWSCTRPGRTAPAHRVRPLAVADHGGLEGVLLALAGDQRAPAGSVGAGPADLALGAVDAQLHAVGRRVGDHIRQRRQPQRGWPGTAKPRAASSGRIWPMVRVMVAVDPNQHRQGLVRQVQAQPGS
jgi:hypothetical protein